MKLEELTIGDQVWYGYNDPEDVCLVTYLGPVADSERHGLYRDPIFDDYTHIRMYHRWLKRHVETEVRAVSLFKTEEAARRRTFKVQLLQLGSK